MDGLIRREYPKKKDFDIVSDEDIEILMDNINNMPRKILNFSSAIIQYAKELSIKTWTNLKSKSLICILYNLFITMKVLHIKL